jgi:hypothetical protein
VTAFKLNEDLKERCILLGASECYTQYIEDPKYQNSPFWYNVIKMGPQMHKNYVMVICNLIDSYLEEFDFLGFSDSSTDVMIKQDCRFVIYCLYSDKENFCKEVNLE